MSIFGTVFGSPPENGSGSGGEERPVYAPGAVRFSLHVRPSCRRLVLSGDEPLIINVSARLVKDQTVLPSRDFDAEISITPTGTHDWFPVSYGAGGNIQIQIVGDNTALEPPLTPGSYSVSVRFKSADGAILQSDRLGIITIL